MEQYYYNRMNKIEQAVYHALYQGFLNIDEEIQIPRLEGEALYNVFFKLRLDHPEIFWATGYKYKYYNDSPNLIFVPEYLFEKAKIKEHQKAMTARVEKITREAKTFSQWDKEKYIHDFLCESIHYDKLKKPYSHEIIGPLGHGVGVCEGIAKSVKVLCDALGIWCMIAVCGNNPEKGIKYRHTWNIVKIDGQYYHLDVTFDNTLGNYEKKENQKVIQTFSFLCLAIAVICGMINFMMAGVLNWFWFAGAGCACAWLVVMVAYYKRRNILKNEMWQLLLISVIAILWDRFTGWKGWSVDFVIPFGILAVQFSVPVIAKINRLEREEYLFYLVQAGIAGLIPMILVWTGIVQFAVPSVICAGISFLTLAALFIFCKKDTMREFHKKLRM